jgi:hypothetical protein
MPCVGTHLTPPKGEAAHHSKKTNMAMHLPDGLYTTNAKENMSVSSPHFNQVFNNNRATNPTLLDKVSQCCILWELDDAISWDKFCKAVAKLENAKAPGLTGVLPEAFKAMSPANLQHVYHQVNDFFLGNADHKQWHRSQCVPVPKTGNLSDPKK